jgi:small subunit ribosomal protein S8
VDPISDMLIRIKNAQKAGQESVSIPYSRFKNEIAETLHRAGLVGSIDRKGKKVRKSLTIRLVYRDDEPAVKVVRFLSKPSRRVFAPYKELRPARGGGILIITTPKGVMSSREARRAKVGGQLIAEVW